MARKTVTPVDPFEEEGSLAATQTGSEEEIDREMDKYTRMMNDCAGVTDGEIVFWLHRANEKNKSLHATYLKRYPKETSFAEIFDEARDQYGAGDYVLLAKKDEVMFRKMSFSTGLPKEPDKPVIEPKVDPMDKLAVAMERMTVVDKIGRIINDARDKPVPPGIDPSVNLMMTMMAGMQAQNTELLKILVTQHNQPAAGGNNALMEAIKLGSALAGGKLPMEEGEGGILGMIGELKPFIPQIIAAFARPSQVRPVLARPGMVVPKPIPASASSGVLNPPASPSVPSGYVPPPTVEDVQAMIMRRIVDEVKFVLTLPATPKLREHVIDYIESYKPDILEQAEAVNAEMFAAYIVTLDPAFSGQEAFFIDLHKQYMAGIDEQPAPANPNPPGVVRKNAAGEYTNSEESTAS